MDIFSKIAMIIIPILITIIGFLAKSYLNQILKRMDTIDKNISNLSEDVGIAVNNTGILTEEVLSIEKQCKIRHKEE